MNKKIAQRVDKNIEKFKEGEHKIKDYVSKLNLTKIKEEHKELANDLGNCFLTTYDVFDAIENQDCFTLALDVTRSQAAIADPTKLVIKEIYPNFLSADSFVEAALFAVGNDPEASGGFDKNADRALITGANRENVTGCFPLYLFHEHFVIAREKMKKIFGFLCTLDPLGFTESQMFTVPFLVLQRAFVDSMNDPQSEKKKQILKLVLDTCVHVFKDWKEQIALVKEIINSPAKRTTQETNPSIPLLFAKVLTILQVDKNAFTKEELIKLFITSIEEIDRRNYGKDDEPKFNKHSMQISMPKLAEEIKNYFLMIFGHEQKFDMTILGDLVSQMEKLSLEEAKDDIITFPFGEFKKQANAQKKKFAEQDFPALGEESKKKRDVKADKKADDRP